MSNTVWIILACAAATYLTRVSGHLILSRFGELNHRAVAALDAVPVAIIGALVAPSVLSNDMPEAVAIIVAGLVALKLSQAGTIVIGLATLIGCRLLLA